MNRIKMKNLYIHIGSHKTGSTYLQKVFHDNYILLSMNGILYPKAGCGGLFGHHDLYSGLKGDDELFFDTIRSIESEIKSGSFDSVLISSENFEYLTQSEIKRLVDVFSCDNVKILYFYRTWSSLLYAMWQEEIKHGSVVTFDTYALRHIAFPFSSTLLNYSIPLQNYEAVVGKESLFVANYEVAKSNNLLGVVLKQIDASLILQNDIQNSELNASFDPFLVEIIRMMNVFAQKNNLRPSYRPKHYYINHACKGEKGMFRHETILSHMHAHKVQSANFNDSHAFLLLLTNFINGYRDCFIDGIELPGDLVKIEVKPFFTISPNYLCSDAALDTLFSAWSDIRELCIY
jgi:hypothetical protein